jgi:hypothetical protein
VSRIEAAEVTQERDKVVGGSEKAEALYNNWVEDGEISSPVFFFKLEVICAAVCDNPLLLS